MDMFTFFLPGPEMAEFRLGWVLHPANSLKHVLNRQEIEYGRVFVGKKSWQKNRSEDEVWVIFSKQKLVTHKLILFC